MSWQDEAACRGRDDIDWFPMMEQPGGQTGVWRENLLRAREVCAGCPVSADCLAEAHAHWGTGGIWAGTTEGQRKRMPSPRPRPAPVALCGTDSGYYRHLRRTHTEPCAACRAAHVAANRERPANAENRRAMKRARYQAAAG